MRRHDCSSRQNIKKCLSTLHFCEDRPFTKYKILDLLMYLAGCLLVLMNKYFQFVNDLDFKTIMLTCKCIYCGKCNRIKSHALWWFSWHWNKGRKVTSKQNSFQIRTVKLSHLSDIETFIICLYWETTNPVLLGLIQS